MSAASSGTIITSGAKRIPCGYSPREFGFLSLVLAHSGVFVMRQFYEFTGAKPGSPTSTFISRLLRGDAHVFKINRRHVYELTGRLYNLTGEVSPSTRLSGQLSVLQQRLMCLDFACRYPNERYLLSETAKVEAFRLADRILIPVRFNSLSGRRHCFPERYPIVQQARGVSFIYPADENLLRFRGFLRRYRALMLAGEWGEVVFVTTNPELGRSAERIFLREMKRRENVDQIEAEFRERADLENRDVNLLVQDDINRLRWMRESRHRNRFEAWKIDPSSLRTTSTAEVHFRVEALEDRYRFLYQAKLRNDESNEDLGISPSLP